MRMNTLEYLKCKPLLSRSWGRTRRNVGLKLGSNYRIPDSKLNWRFARWLEGNENAPDHVGCYGTSINRATRYIGNLPSERFNSDSTIRSLTSQDLVDAKENRLFGYLPVRDFDMLNEVLEFLPVSCSMHVSYEWYDPPGGIIPDTISESLGTHSVMLEPTPRNVSTIRFRHDWGGQWGSLGCGLLKKEYLDRYCTEANILTVPPCGELPVEGEGLTMCGWKWSLQSGSSISIHAREIVDMKSSNRIAWAFCSNWNNSLVCHEFFVWPEFRRQGYAKYLANAVRELSFEMNLPLMVRVSYADSRDESRSGVEFVAELLGVELHVSNNQHIFLEGTSTPKRVSPPSPKLVPPPAASILEWLRPSTELPIEESIWIPILFGTNRNSVIEDTRGKELRYGTVAVEVGQFQRFGGTGRHLMEFAKNVFISFRDRFLGSNNSLTVSRALNGNQFNEYSSFRLGNKLHHVVFIHGFNVSFQQAIEQTARICGDLKINGNMFLFSWPSKGSLTSYSDDEASIEASCEFFREFMLQVQAATNEERISVIAHSMGNRLLARWIKDHSHSDPRLENAIFVAPDVDSEVFSQSLRDWKTAADNVALYANRADIALLSSELKHGYPRAGLVPPIPKVDQMQTIVVEGFALFELAHSYHIGAGNTLHDIYQLLHFATQPESRPRLRRANNPDTVHWILPAN